MEFIGTTDTPNNVKNTLEHKTNSSNSIPFVNISQLNSPCIDTPTLFEHTFENAAYYSVDDNHPKAVDIDIDLKNTYENENDLKQDDNQNQNHDNDEDEDDEEEEEDGDQLKLIVSKDIEIKEENACKMALEIAFPFLIGGIGMVFAGTVLSIVQDWQVFKQVSEVFILVPALLGLKGNLEMTLASRLSTQANIGNMDSKGEQWKMVYGNLALTQVQAIIVGLLASLFAIILGWVPEGKFNLLHGVLLAASSVLTASLATLILGSLMIVVVLVSRRLRINPDNVATPIAASLGDLTTISLLAIICQYLFLTLDKQKWVCPVALAVLLLMVPLWWYVSHHNVYTHNVLYHGWVPVIGAMLISSLGGLVLDYAVDKFVGLAVFQPVINGVGGNLVAVQASRLSTALHKVSSPGTLPENAVKGCPNPISTFFGKSNSSRTARVLMLMVIPGHLAFMLIIKLLHQTSNFSFTAPFVLLYLLASVMQVAILLYTANGMVHFLWARGNDPDNSSIPYLTAIGDLLGTSLLALTFFFLSLIPKK